MLIQMRTTISIEDRLLEALKRYAAEHGETMSSVMTRALQQLLVEPAPRQLSPEFHMIIYGSGEILDHTPGDFASAMEEDDWPSAGRSHVDD